MKPDAPKMLDNKSPKRRGFIMRIFPKILRGGKKLSRVILFALPVFILAGMAFWLYGQNAALWRDLASQALRLDGYETTAKQATGAQQQREKTLLARLDILESAGGDNSDTINQTMDALAQKLADEADILRRQIRDNTAALANLQKNLARLLSDINNAPEQGQTGITPAQIAAIRGELNTAIDTLQTQQDALTTRLNTHIKEANRQVLPLGDTAQTARQTALTQLHTVLLTGGSLNPALTLLRNSGVSIPEDLKPFETTAIIGMQTLKTTFAPAARSALASAQSEQIKSATGLMDRVFYFLKSQIQVRSLHSQNGAQNGAQNGGQNGADTDAILARMQVALDSNNLAEVLAQASTLTPATQTALGDWLPQAQTQNTASQAVRDFQTTGTQK
ncbi:MAG: hypothetical protein ACNYPD_02995 [Candidatus Halichondribacter symbioticus]